MQQLEKVDVVRRKVAPRIAQKRKSELGQFMTPSSVARFMASLFPPSQEKKCRLLDPGAGVGALSCAFLDRWVAGDFGFESVEAYAYEIDDHLREHLKEHLGSYGRVTTHVFDGDFIELAAKDICSGTQGLGFTHTILNPPYKKINTQSAHRRALRSVGIETVNLYSAFVALVVALSAPGGQVVAIIPRSFCNGPYYRPFRDFILRKAAIRHMHLFDSRNKAFKDDDVLQENIIVRLEVGAEQGPVTVSTSTDDTFADYASHEHGFDRIVFTDDSERFIHVPTSAEENTIQASSTIRYSLADLGINVSTGPVVDFRLKEYLRDMPEPGTVPLLYPVHFCGTMTEWPKVGQKKPNAILREVATEKWFYPNGIYCVVRRFSSKEEKRRVVASVVNPAVFGAEIEVLGFENHLNVFHEKKKGLSLELAHGLAVYLNSTAVDENFRRFNGHTQVNATDLKQMKYPSREVLGKLGQWSIQTPMATQKMVDQIFSELVE